MNVDQTTSFCCSLWRYIGYIAVIAYPVVYNIATDMLSFSFFKLKFLVKIESKSRAQPVRYIKQFQFVVYAIYIFTLAASVCITVYSIVNQSANDFQSNVWKVSSRIHI